MKLALIAPVDLLDKYASQSEGVHLVLVHMIQQSEKYAEWYRKRAEAGDTIILDNGAYETNEPAPIPDIIEAAKRVQATTVVAPDFPGRPWHKTVDSYMAFRDKLPEPFKVFGCPQSEEGDVDGWANCFNSILSRNERLSHMGMSILACPIAFGPHTRAKEIELNRFVATAWIRSNLQTQQILRTAKHVKIHYLGLGERVDLIQYYTWADSLDTKGPIKAGLNGLRMHKGWLPRGSSRKLDLHGHFSELNHTQEVCTDANICELKMFMRTAEGK